MTDIRLETAIAAPHELLFVPLGGAGEIGMNLSVYGYGGKWVIVDLGVTFADDSLPGIDVVMPDPAFIADRRDDLLGIVATHAHEDHIGAIPYLWPQLRCPVYATAFTASVLRRKLQEAGLIQEVPLHVTPSSGRFSLKPFDFELIHVTHSLPEPHAVALRTPAGTVLHTGDWKFDPDPLIGAASDFDALRRLGDEGVTALIGDSTNVFRPGEAGSEAMVRRRLSEVIGRYSGKVAVACFASNIARLESVALAAAEHDRQVALVGRSMRRMDQAARENGYLTRLPPFLSEEAACLLPRGKTLLLCTGSQGEPRAALSRIAANQHPNVTLAEGDAVIFSSRIIPGNEKAIGRLHDRLAGNGVEVLSAEQDAQLHVSGHPARDELVRMYELARPRLAIPVHGALRHLVEHAELAKACQVPMAMVVENGAVVRLGPGRAAILDRVPTGRLAVDGNRLIRVDGMALRDRHKLLYGGSATATLVLDRKGGFLAEPVVSLRGLAEADDEVDLIERGRKAVREAVFGMPSGALGDDPAVRETARLALRRAIGNRTGRKPLIDIHLVRLRGVA